MNTKKAMKVKVTSPIRYNGKSVPIGEHDFPPSFAMGLVHTKRAEPIELRAPGLVTASDNLNNGRDQLTPEELEELKQLEEDEG